MKILKSQKKRMSYEEAERDLEVRGEK